MKVNNFRNNFKKFFFDSVEKFFDFFIKIDNFNNSFISFFFFFQNIIWILINIIYIEEVKILKYFKLNFFQIK
jgi:hypothetical protein